MAVHSFTTTLLFLTYALSFGHVISAPLPFPPTASPGFVSARDHKHAASPEHLHATNTTTPAIGARAETYHGRATYFAPGQGACGSIVTAKDFIVALNVAQYGSTSRRSPDCYRHIEVTNTENGKRAGAMIQDACPGCGFGSLDLSPALFQALAAGGLGEGVFPISWRFSDGHNQEEAPSPTHHPKPSATPTRTHTSTTKHLSATSSLPATPSASVTLSATIAATATTSTSTALSITAQGSASGSLMSTKSRSVTKTVPTLVPIPHVVQVVPPAVIEDQAGNVALSKQGLLVLQLLLKSARLL